MRARGSLSTWIESLLASRAESNLLWEDGRRW
jgi:hypothetical protein